MNRENVEIGYVYEFCMVLYVEIEIVILTLQITVN